MTVHSLTAHGLMRLGQQADRLFSGMRGLSCGVRGLSCGD
jgi:hypothetical protein